MPINTRESKELLTAQEITAGTILIKDNALLPKELKFDSEPCVRGWKLVKDFDGHGLDREIQDSGWTFIRTAESVEATVFGIDRQKMVLRAIEKILANPRSENYNSLEITRVDSGFSERFPLVCNVTVFAQSRHIQKSLLLCNSKERPLPDSRNGGVASEDAGTTAEQRPRPRLKSKLSTLELNSSR